MTFRWRLAQFFEIRWWRQYLAHKDPQDYLDWKRTYWHRFLDTCDVHPKSGSRVLDAGCGPAGIFTILDNCETDAVDPLLGAYEKQLPHFKRADYPRVQFFTETLERFEGRGAYDFVFCLNAINHVADLPRSLDRLAGLTAKGGTLVLSVDAHRYGFLKRLFRLFPGDILHPHQYDLEEYRQMLTARGYTVQRSILLQQDWIFDYQVLVAE
jgi:2-polyprenyl-6-hydroxyphenyl methylase/3-demethylubiquinone-9 3-methyltransferase